MITDHRPGLLTVELPHRQHPIGTLLPRGHQRPHEIHVVGLRAQQSQQRMQRAIGIPQRESGAKREPGGVMDLVIGPAVRTINIHEHTRGHERVIQRMYTTSCVPVPPPRSPMHRAHRARQQPQPPCCASKSQPVASASRLAIALASLTPEIATLTPSCEPGSAPKSNTATSPRPSRKMTSSRREPRRERRVVLRFGLTVVNLAADRFARESHREIQLPARSPTAGFAIPCHRTIRANAQPRPEHLARIVVDDRTQIHEKMSGLALGKRVAMQTDTRWWQSAPRVLRSPPESRRNNQAQPAPCRD